MKSVDLTEEKGRLEEEVIASLVDGYLPCAVALNLSKRLEVEAKEIGDTVDTLGIRISDCQLGCFKIEKALHNDLEGRIFSEEITGRIEKSLLGGHLPCKTAHDISREFKVNIKEVGDTATKMRVKIIKCQLGCFA